ncbi:MULTISPECIES: Pycsar system effector family protein [Sphingomonas]|uniref:Pycsar system effector family protein n=1 Tax=Sphingomonas TaxID=13687 RepID=UPI001454E090|nr:Pycsar system effector family protein [Sphingomonas sp. CCH10-B3]
MGDGTLHGASAVPATDAPLAEFASFHEGYLHNYVSLADTKATVLLGLVGTFIAYLFSKPTFTAFLFKPACTPSSWLAWASIVLLAAGAGSAAWVVAPRLKTTGEGLVFFGAVRAHVDAAAYAAAVRSAGANLLEDAWLRHCYDVSEVCWHKYQNLRRAIWLSIAGLVAALPLLASI